MNYVQVLEYYGKTHERVNVVVCMRMVPTDSYVWVLSHQQAEQFEIIEGLEDVSLSEQVWP